MASSPLSPRGAQRFAARYHDLLRRGEAFFVFFFKLKEPKSVEVTKKPGDLQENNGLYQMYIGFAITSYKYYILYPSK